MGMGFLRAQPIRNLPDFQKAAVSYSPGAYDKLNQLRLNQLQADVQKAQLLKPQVFLSSDYLLAPFFSNNGQAVAITPNPSSKAFGYDAALTNGGLYAAQLNVSYPLLNKPVYQAFAAENELSRQVLQQESKTLLHKLSNDVTTLYIDCYQTQQQIKYLSTLTGLIKEREKVVQSLVEQGIMSQNDYLLIDIEISSREFDIAQQKAALCASFSALNNLCGISDTTVPALSAPDIALSKILDKFNYQQKFSLDSMDLIAQQQVSNTKYKPQLQLYGNTGLYASDAANIPHNVGLSAGLHLALPLYDGHQRNITEQQTKVMLQTLGKYQDDQDLQQKNNFASLLQQMNELRLSIGYLDKQIATQKRLLLLMHYKVASGQISVTDYLLAVRDFGIASQNRIQTQSQLWLLMNQYNYLNW